MPVSRLAFLRPDERQIFINSLGGDWQPKLEEFERTGNIPAELTNQSIRTKLEELPKDKGKFMKEFLARTEDEASLPDEILQMRSEALSGVTPELQKDYAEKVQQSVRDVISRTNTIPEEMRETFTANASKAILEGATNVRLGEVLANLVNAMPPQYQRGFQWRVNVNKLLEDISGAVSVVPIPESKATKENLSRIEGIISSRQRQREEQAAASEIIRTLPQELARGREEFLGGQAEAGISTFQQEAVPRIRESLNVRGLLFGGDLPSELARGAGEISSVIEEQRAQLESQDEQFFQNAAYQETLRRELQAGQDVGAQAAFERGRARQTQEFSFQRAQADLGRRFSEIAERKRAEAQVSAERAQLQRQRERERAGQEAETFGQIAQAGAQIGTAAILPKRFV